VNCPGPGAARVSGEGERRELDEKEGEEGSQSVTTILEELRI